VRGSREFAEPLLTRAGLPAGLADALDDASWDAGLLAETDHALSLTGRDVGTPLIQFPPPEGVAFFGPVISRLPASEEAVPLWDHVVGLAAFPGFAELKRSLCERPQLRASGRSASRAVPTPAGLVMTILPPIASTRSFRPISPEPRSESAPPTPSSATCRCRM
jgi:hypothetical protein